MDASGISYLRSGRLDPCTPTRSINPVAEELGEHEDWLRDVASEMEIEDGVIWVYGVADDGIMAFTDFGIESPIELIKMCKENHTRLKHSDPEQ